VVVKLDTFRRAGIGISLDDFGTGYSAMAYLKKFAIDHLKIDRSFVRDMVSDPNDHAIIEAIIVMAHKLGIRVIAEGVETAEQSAQLSEAGCDFAQGYHFARPMPAAEFEALLARRSPAVDGL
jgi:EAL domain-containing protein (putative c-di-GMP-specific phosphodiesterase class I)